MPRQIGCTLVYANEAERLADTFDPGYLGWFALQLSDGSLWVLVNYDPATWAPAGGAAGGGGEVLIDGGAALLFDDAGDLVYEG